MDIATPMWLVSKSALSRTSTSMKLRPVSSLLLTSSTLTVDTSVGDGVAVGEAVGVGVGVDVGVGVGMGVGIGAIVGIGVGVGSSVGESVSVLVDSRVGVGMRVASGVETCLLPQLSVMAGRTMSNKTRIKRPFFRAHLIIRVVYHTQQIYSMNRRH